MLVINIEKVFVGCTSSNDWRVSVKETKMVWNTPYSILCQQDREAVTIVGNGYLMRIVRNIISQWNTNKTL